MTKVAFRSEWSKNGAIDKLLSELNSGTRQTPNGGIQFTASDHRDLFYLLADAITFPDTITRRDVSAISYRSFIDLRKLGIVSRKALLSAVSISIAELESLPQKRYTMWTKCRLSSMSFVKEKRFNIDGVSIRTAAHLPKWLWLDEHFISGIGRINPNVLPFFGYFILATDARNENEASKKIFGAFDIFLSISNTLLRSIELWSQRVPSAKLWTGPNQFFFEKRKFIGEDHVWFDQNYDENAWNRFPMAARDFVKHANSIKRELKTLAGHPLRPQLESALLLINEGMISDDLAFRLMRFWSAAEALYAPEEERTSTKALISRLTFASKADEWIDKIKLERCYHLRNQYVHRGSNEDDDTSLVQHLRELLLHQVYYYLRHGQDILTQKDLLMMVDTRPDEAEIERRTLAIQRRLNIERTGRHYTKP